MVPIPKAAPDDWQEKLRQAGMGEPLQSFGAINAAMNSLALDGGTLGAPAYTMVVNTPAAISYTASDLVKR